MSRRRPAASVLGGEMEIVRRRSWIAGRVVVDEDHAGGIKAHRVAEQLPHSIRQEPKATSTGHQPNQPVGQSVVEPFAHVRTVGLTAR